MANTVIKAIGKAKGKAKATPHTKAKAEAKANTINDLEIQVAQPWSRVTQASRGVAKGLAEVAYEGTVGKNG